MTSELLDAISETSNDDGPRLVYADWLQQQADAITRARGEYIALTWASFVGPTTARFDVARWRQRVINALLQR